MTNQEINEAVARKLGWGGRRGGNPPKGPYDGDAWSRDGIHWEGLPDYSGSIAPAWEIVSHFRKWTLSAIDSEDVCFSWIDELGELNALRADTAPLAICLAFLKLP